MKQTTAKQQKISDRDYCTLLLGANMTLLLLALSRYFDAYITIILIAMTLVVVLNYVKVWETVDDFF